MAEVYSGNIIQCSHCGKYIHYSDSDIKVVEKDYGVATYYGETYKASVIKCPNCGLEIEI